MSLLWRTAVQADEGGQRFFHATDRRLSGKQLLPSSQTGKRNTSPKNQWYSPNHVYMYAADDWRDHLANAHHGKYVYEVQPHDDVEPDPEIGNRCYRASGARILGLRYGPSDPW